MEDPTKLHELVGRRLSIVIRSGAQSGDIIESDLIAVDAEHQLAVFRRQPPHTFQKSDYAIVALSEIISVHNVGECPTAFTPRLIDASEIKSRVAEGDARAQKRLAHLGVGVSPEAQHVFDFVNKTLTSEWRGTDFIVVSAVIVRTNEPGFPSEIAPRAHREHQEGLLERVRMIIAKARDTWAANLNSGGGSADVAPPFAASGGEVTSGVGGANRR